MWTLILTIIATNGGNGVASSIEHVPGFADQRSCNEAGLAWYRGIGNDDARSVAKNARCVEMKLPEPKPLVPKK